MGQHSAPAPQVPETPEPGQHSLPGPWSVLKASTRKVPQLRWAYAVVGVVAASAIARGLGVAPGDLLLVVLPFLFAMLLLFVFSRMAGGVIGVMFTWAIMLLIVITLIGLITSVFFDVPKPITVLADQLRMAWSPDSSGAKRDTVDRRPSASSEATTSFVLTGDTTLDLLPARFKSSGSDKKEASVHAGDLVIDGSVLSLPDAPVGSTVHLVADRLVLKNGGRIRTGSSGLDLYARQIESSSGSIIAFERPAGEAASMLSAGDAGLDGRSAGDVKLTVVDRIDGRLRISLDGEGGRAGGSGKDGTPGAAGIAGDNAASGALDCRRGAGDGKPGENGSAGSDGSRGGNGGSGGRLLVVGSTEVAQKIDFTAKGGAGGLGGRGGKGGAGGLGGRGGDARPPFCVGDGKDGLPGAPGKDGSDGLAGTAGRAGTFEHRAP